MIRGSVMDIFMDIFMAMVGAIIVGVLSFDEHNSSASLFRLLAAMFAVAFLIIGSLHVGSIHVRS